MSAIVREFEHSLALSFFGIGMKNDLFQFFDHCWVFQIFWHNQCNTYYRIWDSLAGIPSLPLALSVVMLPKAHLTSHSRMSGSRWVSHHRGDLGHEDLFCVVVLCIRPEMSVLWTRTVTVVEMQMVDVSKSDCGSRRSRLSNCREAGKRRVTNHTWVSSVDQWVGGGYILSFTGIRGLVWGRGC